jgi:hypothetical protein
MTMQQLPRRLVISVFCFVFYSGHLSYTGISAQGRQSLSAIEIVNQMVQAETAAARNRQHFLYRREVRSARTKGHLWDELVVETSDGRIQRLISEDGKPLSDRQKKAEGSRITYLVNHPEEFRRETQGRKDDEVRVAVLLRELPQVFMFKTAGSMGDCTRITFQPNPSFQERSYQDRVVHAMSGVLLIHTTDIRLCGLDAHLEHRVEFGFGLLGEVSDQSHFSIARQAVSPGQWKTTRVRVHVDGSILLFKSVSRDEDSLHFGFEQVARDLTPAEAAAIVSSNTF